MHIQEWAYVGLGLAVGATILGACTEFAKTLIMGAFEAVLRLVFVERAIDDDYTGNMVHAYLGRNAKSYGLQRQVYDTVQLHVRGETGLKHVVRRRAKHSWRLYWFRGAPIIARPGYHGDNVANTYDALWHLRGTIDWERLLTDSARLADELASDEGKTGRYRVKHHFGSRKSSAGANAPDGGDDEAPRSTGRGNIDALDPDQTINYPREILGEDPPEKPLELLSLTKSMNLVAERVRKWFNLRAWYEDRSIPWRYGVNLYGLPGTGKTSLVRALGQELDLPIHVFHLETMDDLDFVAAWSRTRSSDGTPRIVLLEDVDNVFHGRKNVADGSELSFGTLLNAIDGVERENGLLLFITTNHISKIDAALGAPDPEHPGCSTRPGRIDLVAELGPLDHAGREKLAARIVRDAVTEAKLVIAYPDAPAAQFQDACIRAALGQQWEEP